MLPDQQPSENSDVGQRQTIPVIEEQLVVDKKVIETGHIRITKRVFEEEKTFEFPVLTEEFDIERVPVNQYIDTAPPAVRYEGDTMIVPVLQEVIVVEKRLLLVEEVHIHKRQTMSKTTEQVTLRREEVHIERNPASPGSEEQVRS
ncbi:YsnF/AvaK domain-containing protein [Larkinella sp. VNQ87]|uniref:YsnF/AvaK domain-containing protein n=1 Tax=Larkinella sp. VNQ87 TaxID=3400921 RepID=UPI003C1210F8